MPTTTTPETDALITALVTLSGNLPIAALDLREGRLSATKQHDLGSLVIQVGELLHQHADLDSEPTDTQRQRALWLPEPDHLLTPP